MNEPYRKEWHEVWDYFGYEIEDSNPNHASCYTIIPDDREAADYIYGWYMYVSRDTWMDTTLRELKGSRKLGYADAQDHYGTD